MPSLRRLDLPHTLSALALGLCLVAGTRGARAQVLGDPVDATADDPNKPPDEAAAPAPEGLAVVYAPAPQPVVAPAPLREPFSTPRVRYGMSALGGATRVTGQDYQGGGFGGVSFRLGVQINRTWGVYYQGQGSLGGYAYADTTSDDAGGVLFASWFNTVLASAILFDRLELAFGPSFDSIASLSFQVDAGTGDAEVYGLDGTVAGAHLRIAGILGAVNPMLDRRVGFSIAFELHPTFIDRHLILTLGLGLGVDWY